MRYTILFIAARIASDGSAPIPGVFGRVKAPFSQLSTLLVKCRNGSKIECFVIGFQAFFHPLKSGWLMMRNNQKKSKKTFAFCTILTLLVNWPKDLDPLRTDQ